MTGRQRAALLAAVLAAFAGLSAVLYAAGINCPVRYLTGLSCPGCGMTRACLALLSGHPAAAARYHPLVFVVPPLIVYACLGRRPLFGGKKRALAVVCAVCALMLATYVVRLALHDPVLPMNIRDGLLCRVFAAAAR